MCAPRPHSCRRDCGRKPSSGLLSYASQDAEAAKRICDTLRAAGIEVWFDQSELRGEIPKALDWLDTAYRLRDSGLSGLKTDRWLDPLRQEPRFREIERKLYPETS